MLATMFTRAAHTLAAAALDLASLVPFACGVFSFRVHVLLHLKAVELAGHGEGK